MSLYFDAAKVLSQDRGQGSLKSRIYGDKDLRSNGAQVFALISETSKCDDLLKEVLDNAGLLQDEPKLTPLIALLLAHDHFFSKSGISAPTKHPIRQAFELHRARLQAEFTRARLRRKCPDTETLKRFLAEGKGTTQRLQPRWVRINQLVKRNSELRAENLLPGSQVGSLGDVLSTRDNKRCYHFDEHIPDLIAFPPDTDLTNTKEYRDGEIILQDKASCFPAYLLLGGEQSSSVGDVMDGCAAPGNKTTHLAAIMTAKGFQRRILACERDEKRSKILRIMVSKAGAEKRIDVLAPQDFLALDPDDARLNKVTHLLLDPSCSGSGILGREEIPQLCLPEDPRATSANQNHTAHRSKKRKREHTRASTAKKEIESSSASRDEASLVQVTDERLHKLSNLQAHIVEHAMSFLAATVITYSTCSIHQQENEVVVSRVLVSKIAQQRGWRLLPQESQVEGLRKWRHRGIRTADSREKGNTLDQKQLDACIRCYPDDEEGTMGFFVCAFVRDAITSSISDSSSGNLNSNRNATEDDWEGFDD